MLILAADSELFGQGIEAVALLLHPIEATVFLSLWDYLALMSQRHQGCRNAAESVPHGFGRQPQSGRNQTHHHQPSRILSELSNRNRLYP